MTELIWDGKYKDGKRVAPLHVALPFQTVETVNESAQLRQRALELFSIRTAPCVPAIKKAVDDWRAGNYKGVTDTTHPVNMRLG